VAEPSIGKPLENLSAAGTSDGSAAWSDADLTLDPHARSDKPDRVRRMFASIAGSYDLNNRLHSFWLDQAWRRFAVRQARVGPTDTALDVACGTGDLAELLARAGAARVTGLDFTEEMLAIARTKAARRPVHWNADRITYIRGDAQELLLDTASVDVVTIAFGIRNVQEPSRAITEFRRVLRSRGRLVILEFSEPTWPPARWVNNVYCQQVMPRTASWIARDKSGAYKYLPRSVQTFQSPDNMRNALDAAGFETIQITPLTLGVCVCYAAYL